MNCRNRNGLFLRFTLCVVVISFSSFVFHHLYNNDTSSLKTMFVPQYVDASNKSTTVSTEGTTELKITVGTPNDLEDLMKRFQLAVGKKYAYMSTEWWGRFGNNLLTVLHGMEIARRSGRVFLFPIMNFQFVAFEHVLDFSGLKDLGYEFASVTPEFGMELRNLINSKNVTVVLNDQSSDFPLWTWSSAELFYKCIGSNAYQRMFEVIKPTAKYKNAIDRIWSEHLKLDGHKVLGVHLRRREGVCGDVGEMFAETSRKSIVQMCSLDWNVVNNISQSLTIGADRLFLASDRQNDDQDSSFWIHSEVVRIDWEDPLVKEIMNAHSLVDFIIDFLMLTKVDYFIGNPISSFSAIASMMRVASTKSNKEVLSWPLVDKKMTKDSFWECYKFEPWCAGEGSKPDC
jgi:hypothetical protein